MQFELAGRSSMKPYFLILLIGPFSIGCGSHERTLQSMIAQGIVESCVSGRGYTVAILA